MSNSTTVTKETSTSVKKKVVKKVILFKDVQKLMNVKKTRYNSFSKFFYRSVGDIYNAWNELDVPFTLNLSDEIIEKGGRLFVEATATVSDAEGVKVIASSKAAAELSALGRAGMSSEQSTGSASSYARKYALDGLFLLDDNKDPDSLDSTKLGNVSEARKKIVELQTLIKGNEKLIKKVTTLLSGKSILKMSPKEIDAIIKAVK